MFYAQLELLCAGKGTTPSALALSVGMSKANVTNWRNGASPKLDTLEKLADALGVPVAALLEKGDTHE